MEVLLIAVILIVCRFDFHDLILLDYVVEITVASFKPCTLHNLARSANLPEGLYILPMFFLYFFFYFFF